MRSKIVFESEGEPVEALLVRPPVGRQPWPAVIVSPARLRAIDELDWLIDSLANSGYAVLAHRYRDGQSRYQMRDVEDIRNAVSELYRLTDVDTGRIAIIGHSRGASASLRAAALDPRIRATVALGAPTDIAGYVQALRAYAPSRYQLMVSAYGATPEDDPEYYAAISPLAYAAQIKTPVLLIHGTNDLIAPQQHSERMYMALRESGNRSVALEIVADMGHFFELAMRGYAFETVARMFLRWLDDAFGRH